MREEFWLPLAVSHHQSNKLLGDQTQFYMFSKVLALFSFSCPCLQYVAVIYELLFFGTRKDFAKNN